MSEFLKELENFAEENHIPILRKQSRNILIDLIKKNQPQQVLEIGTAIGYSGSLILNNCNCLLTTIDISQQMIKMASKTFKKQKISNRVTILVGDAINILSQLVEEDKKFDFIFLDGPKTHYLKQLPYLLNLLNKNGVILVDNVLFMGEILSNSYPKHKHRTAILSLRKFLYEVQNNNNLESELIQVEDGLLIIKKRYNLTIFVNNILGGVYERYNIWNGSWWLAWNFAI